MTGLVQTRQQWQHCDWLGFDWNINQHISEDRDIGFTSLYGSESISSKTEVIQMWLGFIEENGMPSNDGTTPMLSHRSDDLLYGINTLQFKLRCVICIDTYHALSGFKRHVILSLSDNSGQLSYLRVSVDWRVRPIPRPYGSQIMFREGLALLDVGDRI